MLATPQAETSSPMARPLAELTENELLPAMRQHGLPPLGIALSYLPSDAVLRELTAEFGVEFAAAYTQGQNNRKGHYTLYAGDKESCRLSDNPREYLLKHTHPAGTEKPSEYDIQYLRDQQAAGSKQVKSVILPAGKSKITFDTNTPFVSAKKHDA